MIESDHAFTSPSLFYKGGGDSGVYRVSGGKSGGSEEEAQRHPRLA